MAGTFSNVVTKPSPVPFTGAASTSPFSTALNNVASGNRTSTSSTIQPSTPLKSITTNNIDGSSTKHEFHPEDQGIQKSQADAFATAYKAQPQQGLLSSYQTGGNTNASPNLVGTQSAQGTSSANYPTTDGAPPTIAQNNAAGTPQNSFGQAVGGLLNRGSQDSPEVRQARQGLLSSQMAESNALAQNRLNPIPLEFQQGREQILANQYLQQQNALTNQLGSAVTTQGQQNAALGNAGSLVSPRQNGYVLIDPATGQPMGGTGGLNSAIKTGAQADAAYSGALSNATDNQAISGAQNNIDSLTQLIQNSPELNKSGVNLQNAGYAILQKNLSSSDRATLENTLATINAALSKVTGSPVDIGQLSNSQGTSIVTTINNAIAAAKGIAAGKISGQSAPTSQSSDSLYSF